jgi:prepilin-type N-terminal cleavage/methylation domain-containing protein
LREVAVETREKGFSLVELMIAMVVTLIITSAVFQLVSAGKTAFRKEPAMADRQQNIRAALDLISQDIYKAGLAVPDFSQVFTRNLDASGPMGSGGVGSDQLELVAAADCGILAVCKVDGVNIFTTEPLNTCFQFPTAVIVGCDTGTNCPTYDVYWAYERGAGDKTSTECKSGHMNMPTGRSELNPPGGKRNFDPQWVFVGSIVRYRINVDADGTPNLERSPLGGANDTDGNSSWQVLARGIEDLQVQYETSAGWSDDPGPTSDINTLVRRVRVRLSARALEQNLSGQTTSPAGGNAVRGELEVAVAPRAAMSTLGMNSGEL